ncbi:MAG TPA: TIGR02281 family clan AA aspartic protease [Usitatibacter sp.]
MKIHGIAALAIAGLALPAEATDVNVIGLFPGKAVVSINRGPPRTLSAGVATAEGVTLVSTTRNDAVLEIDGKRQTLELGQDYQTPDRTGGRQSVTLPQDPSGHFITDAMVNGVHTRFLVDTGATVVSLPASEASRMGIDYRKGTPGYSITADGRRIASWRVVLDSVTVGDVKLLNVDGAVSVGDGIPLLGMSFLNRTELRREGSNLTLTKRY